MSIAVDPCSATVQRDLVEDFDDTTRPGRSSDTPAAPSVRRACPECGVVLVLDPVADGATVPDHVVCPSVLDPFGIRPCPGSGATVTTPADRPVAGPPPALPKSPIRTLPPGLDWRAQPFSHTA
ncbi:hypothetical protein [Embleya sp. NPDC020630]|uniref:hypothetical protein n=1 Tax=Embleya sp. NPDC020630 TaxID=3363979 RepID=UPI0037A27F56